MNKEELKEMSLKDVQELDRLLKYFVENPKVQQLRHLKPRLGAIDIESYLKILSNDELIRKPTTTSQITEKGKKHHQRGGYTAQWDDLQTIINIQKVEQNTNIWRNKAMIASAVIAGLMLIITIIGEVARHRQNQRIHQLENDIQTIKTWINSNKMDTVVLLPTKVLPSAPPHNKKNTEQSPPIDSVEH